ncbi:MAG: YhbY family RNA-binding protein [Methanobacteriota archaeon]
MDSKTRAMFKGKAQSLKVTLRAGKAGLTETLAKELDYQLKENKLVKARILKGDVEDIARKLAEAARAELVEVRGKTAVFWRK